MRRGSGPRCGSSPGRSSRLPPTCPSRRCVRCLALPRPITPPSASCWRLCRCSVTRFLSYAQRMTGRELARRRAVADSKQTLLCSYLPPCCSWDSCSTSCSVGRGPTRSQDWSSPSSRSMEGREAGKGRSSGGRSQRTRGRAAGGPAASSGQSRVADDKRPARGHACSERRSCSERADRSVWCRGSRRRLSDTSSLPVAVRSPSTHHAATRPAGPACC